MDIILSTSATIFDIFLDSLKAGDTIVINIFLVIIHDKIQLMEKPKISVLMSVYNGEKYLNYSIESILSQSFKDCEFIIIDDGSTDDSLKIIESYKQKDKRIIIIHNTKISVLQNL